MFIRDSFTRGLVAGVAAGIVIKPYDLLAYYLGFSTVRWFDFAGTMMYGKKPLNLTEQVFATVGT